MQGPLTSRSLFLILFNRWKQEFIDSLVTTLEWTSVSMLYTNEVRRRNEVPSGIYSNETHKSKRGDGGRVRDGGEQKWWPKRSRAEQMVRSCFRHHRLSIRIIITTITTMSLWCTRQVLKGATNLVNLLLNLLLSPWLTCCFVYILSSSSES